MTPIQFIFIILAAITLGAAFMVVTISKPGARRDLADRNIIRGRLFLCAIKRWVPGCSPGDYLYWGNLHPADLRNYADAESSAG